MTQFREYQRCAPFLVLIGRLAAKSSESIGLSSPVGRMEAGVDCPGGGVFALSVTDTLAIRVRGLKKVFAKRRGFRGQVRQEWALKGVDFDVGYGETYGLLGPNGSGKSTLIRLLATLLVKDGGEMELLGFKLPEQEAEVRRRIGRVSVDAAFYKKLSPRENLLYTGMLYGLDSDYAQTRGLEILEQLGFPARRYNDPLEDMSRGMQQKVTIARALMVDPPLLLLDEPTTGLDPKSKRDVQQFLESLRERRGTTILLTTHDMLEAERLCARIGLLAHGALIAEGTADELKALAKADNLEDAFLKLSGEALNDDEDPEERDSA